MEEACQDDLANMANVIEFLSFNDTHAPHIHLTIIYSLCFVVETKTEFPLNV